MVIRTLRKLVSLLGYDLIKSNKKIAEDTLLGLKHLPIKTVLDIGANTGQFANYSRKIFPNAAIYAFEPIPDVYKELNSWCKQDGNAFAYNTALGEFKGFTDITLHKEHNDSSSLLQTTEFTEKYYPFTKNQDIIKIEINTLDNWEIENNISIASPFIIKIDVQGYENRVILGGKNVLKKAKAVVLEVCLKKLYKEQATFKELNDMLYDLGFEYVGNFKQTFSETGEVIYIDMVFIK